MAALSPAQLIDKYQSLCDYASTGDVAKAKDFRTVCLQLLAVMPVRSRTANTETDMNVNAIQAALKSVDDWIKVNDVGVTPPPKFRGVDLRRYRD